MTKVLFKNIKNLVGVYDQSPGLLRGKDMSRLPSIANAWLACEDGLIADYGSMKDFPGISDWKDLEVVDCSGKILLPAFCDSHTHIVYAGTREQEFVDRINGLSYEEVARRGGGILNSAEKLRQTSEDDLFNQSKKRLEEVIGQGTGAIEIKSGYGLDMDSELKMLRVIRRLKELNWIPVKSTFLGAHAVPKEYKGRKQEYVKHLITEILPAVAAESLADYIDVFCERDYFNAEETKSILEAGLKYGMKGKVHAEQLSHNNGIKTAIACGAVSADHLEFCSDEDIQLFKNSETIPTILPGAAYFLSLPLPPARKMIEAGLGIAFASDFNPGSCPTGNMKLMLSMACIQYKLNPEEAINSVTVNSARAMEQDKICGTITPGKLANLIVTSAISSYNFLPYAYGTDCIDSVYINGQEWKA